MQVIRRHLSWLIAGWLACQVAAGAGVPAFAALWIDQDVCCRALGPGQTCPMHQSAGDRTCKMRSDCPRAEFAIMAIFNGFGILPEPAALAGTPTTPGAVMADASASIDRPDRPDPPPPRA